MSLTELITWHQVEAALPDSDTTVMIYAPAGDPPVWIGYHDGTQWLTADAWTTPVTHWAEIPRGPHGAQP